MTIDSSSQPGAVNQPTRPKATSDNTAPNQLQSLRGGVPIGADGLLLIADSTNPLGVIWSPGGGINASLLDAKGDIIAASANDTPAKVGVGADGTVLTASAAAPSGVAWQVPSPANVEPAVAVYKGAGVVGASWNFLTPAGAVLATTGNVVGLTPVEIVNSLFARSGKTTHFQLTGTVITNATSPASTFTLRLYSLTYSGGSGALNFGFNVQQGGSLLVANPAAGGTATATLDLGAVADGIYAIACVSTAVPALNSVPLMTAQLNAIYV